MGKIKKYKNYKIKESKLPVGIKLIPSKEEMDNWCNQVNSMDHRVMANFNSNEKL
jgi:dihydroorotate dehydrogenase